MKRTQRSAQKDPKFTNLAGQLNLQKDERGIYVCVGRVQGEYPTFLPTNHLFSEKLVMNAHRATMHGGVGLMITHVREKFWIPQLRKIAKSARAKCFGCKRSRVTLYDSLPWLTFQLIGQRERDRSKLSVSTTLVLSITEVLPNGRKRRT